MGLRSWPDRKNCDPFDVESHSFTVKRLKPIHSAQVVTYIKLAKLRHGVLINFNVMLLKYGVRMFVNDQDQDRKPTVGG